MKIVLYTVMISPHQLPLARELVKRVGHEEFRYVYLQDVDDERKRMGWDATVPDTWCRRMLSDDPDLETCEVLLSGVRDVQLFERRTQKRLKTYYMSERWFKPIAGIFPGWIRLCNPGFLRMALRFRRLIRRTEFCRYFYIGEWARHDMLRICGRGFASKMTPWGYFVEPSSARTLVNRHKELPLRILWAGRMLRLKHVETIVKALKEACKRADGAIDYSLTLIGSGPEKDRLEALAKGLPVKFVHFLPLPEVRAQMQLHDVFVFASDARDGWGAVVSEALEEGMHVLGTAETGAAATMLSSEDLFHVKDVDALAKLLERCLALKKAGELFGQGIRQWSAANAAERLLST